MFESTFTLNGNSQTCIQGTAAVGHWVPQEIGWFSFGPQSMLSAIVSFDNNWLHIRNSSRSYRKNHLKLPVTMLWIASFTLKEKCFGRQRWPSLLSISRVNKSTPIYNADLVGSVLIPITGLPLLRILLAPIKNVPSPPVVTTMSAHLNFRWSK